MISAGRLKDKIVFQKPVRTKASDGEVTTTYTQVLNTSAEAKEIRSNPELIASQENIKQLVRFTIRYRPLIPIQEGFRAVWRGFNFTVNNIWVDPKRTKIEITVHSEMETSSRQENVPGLYGFPYALPLTLS